MGLLAMPDVGITWDEPLHLEYGRRLIAFYSSWGNDHSIIGFAKANYYGGLYDMAGELLARLFPAQPWWVPRHYLTLALGVIGVFATGRLAGRFGGPLAAGFASLLLLLTGRWSGHSFFDPKDIPFSVTYLLATMALIRLADELPRPTARSWVLVALSMGATIAVRIGGLLLFAILAAAIGLHLLGRLWPGSEQISRRGAAALALRLGWRALASGCGALGVSVAFWPYLQSETWKRLLEVYRVNAAFPWRGRMLFLGEVVKRTDVGRDYLPIWLMISLPLLTLVGLILLPASRIGAERGKRPTVAFGILLLAALFPIIWVELKGAVLYNGIRHFLFVIPLLTVLATLGWTNLWHRLAKRSYIRAGVAAAAIALAVEPAEWLVRSEPYQYVYFNPLAGGLARASHSFGSEYWRASLLRAAQELDRRADSLPEGKLLIVRVHDFAAIKPFLRAKSRVRLVRMPNPRWQRASLEVVFGAVAVRQALRASPNSIVYQAVLDEGQLPFWLLRSVGPAARAIGSPGHSTDATAGASPP